MRKLSTEEEKEAKKLLSLKANKKMIKDRLAEISGKPITLKDLSNISTSMKSGKTRNDLETTVKELINKHGNCIIFHRG